MSEPTQAKPDRTWLYLGLGFVALWCAYLAFFAPKFITSEPALDVSGLSRPADYSWSLLDLDDRPVKFSDYKGKAVFLNVWATWCPPCVREMPSIAALAADPRMKDVAFVCVSADANSGTVKRFMEGKGWPMTVLRASGVPEVFATQGIPATFLIAPDGKIVSREEGARDWHTPEVVSLLATLAKPKPAGEGEAP